MLKRYSRLVMEKIWSEGNKFRCWLLVEIAVLQARHRFGELPFDVPADLAERITIDPAEINRIEKEITKHDVKAFLDHVSPQFPEDLRPWLHKGMTSYDVGDTALSLQMRESAELLIEGIDVLMEEVKKKALEHKHTPQIGRTHGVHAEPITFGVKLANWYNELKRHRSSLECVRDMVSVVKISGAVGMYTIDPAIEDLVGEHLGLEPIIATQVISRDIVATYVATLAIISASIGKFATNIRLMARTEVGEVLEPFSKDQVGSSAMPHKKNPIGSENITGLMRVSCANLQIALENLAACWEERSLDNSGAERVIIPDSSILLDYAMARFANIIRDMRVYPERMKDNINFTKGLIFSQEVMMIVAEKSGLPREDAHKMVREVALQCWETRQDFLEALLESEVVKHVSEEDLRACFNLEPKLRYVDHIFKKVFGE